MRAVYHDTRPLLTIERTGGKSLGRCYSATYYKITSRSALSQEVISRLRAAGFLGNGQEFLARYVTASGEKVSIPEKVDYRSNIEPTGEDTVECVDIDSKTGNVLGPAINPYTRQPYASTQMGYYVYECEDRVDSSD